MGKEQEHSLKKRSKRIRKRLRKVGSGTVDFTNSVEAAKRRRKAGRRRLCEGMCFSLPTLDDPFNDRTQRRPGKRKASRMQEEGKEDSIEAKGFVNRRNSGTREGRKTARLESLNGTRKEKHGRSSAEVRTSLDCTTEYTNRSENAVARVNRCLKGPQSIGVGELNGRSEKHGSAPSQRKYPDKTASCTNEKADLNVIHNGMWRQDSDNIDRVKWMPILVTEEEWTDMGGNITAEDAFRLSLSAVLDAQLPANLVGDFFTREKLEGDENREKVANKWEWQFWRASGTGSDILSTCGASGLVKTPAYVLAAAAHISGRRLQNGLCHNPVGVILLASQGQTLRVRQVCRPLKKVLNIQSISLHPGTPIQRQIEGLSTKLPEILVATPDRLCKLLALQAVCISNVSFMVVDDIMEILACGFADQLIEIRSLAHPCVQTAILSDSFSDTATAVCRKLLRDPISRVTSDSSVAERSACITQSVAFVTSEETRPTKLLKILKQSLGNQQETGALVILQQSDGFETLVSVLESEEYSVGCFRNQKDTPSVVVMEHFRKGEVQVLLSTEDAVGQLDLGQFKTVINYDFPSTVHAYCHVLTRMASRTINGILHSFCSGSTAPLASQLVQLLVRCSQPVPSSLKMLAEAAAVVQQNKLSSH